MSTVAISKFALMFVAAIFITTSSLIAQTLWDDVQRVPVVTNADGKLLSCKSSGLLIEREGPVLVCIKKAVFSRDTKSGNAEPMSLQEIAQVHVVTPANKKAIALGLLPALMAGPATSNTIDPFAAWIAVKFQ